MSKVKCDNDRPCKRCQKKGLECVTKSSDSSPFPAAADGEQPPQNFEASAQQDGSDDFGNGVPVYLDETNTDAQALLDLYNTTGYSQHTIPAFFEQIMVPEPDFMGIDFLQPPPDLAAWMPEVDWLSSGDIFGNDFTPAIDQMLEAQVSQEVPQSSEIQSLNVTDTSHDKIDNNSARRRHAAFKQSAWYMLQSSPPTSADLQ